MISIVRTIAKLCAVIAAVAAIQPTTLSYAADTVAYASATGSGISCTVAQPCGDLPTAIGTALAAAGTGIARVICLTPVSTVETVGHASLFSNQTIEVDCPQGFTTQIQFLNLNVTGVFRGVTFTRSLFGSSILFQGNGTLILEDCAFVDVNTTPLSIQPVGAVHLVIRNCRFSNSSSGMLLKPAAGGSITATLDHVTITGNAAGGIKIDTTNGAVTVDITDSIISNNVGNGINVVGNAGGQAVVSIKNSVIAKNGVAGVQVNGANAGVMIATTLLDQNATGALSVLGGGSLLTYGNNSIVGPQGSNFTGTAALK
jgi:Right handed beta helix region